MSELNQNVMCVRAEELLPTLPDKFCHTFLTDVPYREVNRPDQGLRSFDKGEQDSGPVNLRFLTSEAVRLSRGSIVIWCGWRQVSLLTRLLADRHGLTARVGMYRCTNPSPINCQHFYLSALQFCVMAKKPGAPFFRHYEAPYWEGPNQRVRWHENADGKWKNFPGPKPVWLLREQIEALTPPGEMVLDPFCGSGSTGVACAGDYRFLLADKQQECVDLALRRVRVGQ
jgi:site-specific DNA-methyltransferase (adenine-specific)